MATKHLQADAALTKIKDMAEAIDFAMLCTNLGSKPFHAIPMSTKRVDEAGSIWFLSGRDSTHNANIQRDHHVELIYSQPSSMRFLNVFGQATICTDRETLASLYGGSDDAWFDGVDDPNLTALEVKPIDAHYWDTKSNRLIALLKMGVSAVTGSNADLGEHGNLTV